MYWQRFNKAYFGRFAKMLKVIGRETREERERERMERKKRKLVEIEMEMEKTERLVMTKKKKEKKEVLRSCPLAPTTSCTSSPFSGRYCSPLFPQQVGN